MDTKPFPSEQRNIDLIVIDLDGTLLNSDSQMSDRNRDAIRKALDAGKRVVLATGKTRTSAESLIAALNLTAPGIFVQGLLTVNADGSIRSQQTLKPDAVRRAIQYADEQGFEVIAYAGNRLLAKHTDSPIGDIVKYNEPLPEAVGSLVNIVQHTPINKLVILGDSPRKLKALRWQLNQQVGDDVGFTSTAVLHSLEVLPKGGSKGQAVRRLLLEMNVDPASVMAIGDAENDIEMLKLAGLGVAMGNAHDSVKAIADEVTLSNDEDGVAVALERFVLPPEQAAVDDEAANESTATTEGDPSPQTASAPAQSEAASANPSSESSESEAGDS